MWAFTTRINLNVNRTKVSGCSKTLKCDKVLSAICYQSSLTCWVQCPVNHRWDQTTGLIGLQPYFIFNLRTLPSIVGSGKCSNFSTGTLSSTKPFHATLICLSIACSTEQTMLLISCDYDHHMMTSYPWLSSLSVSCMSQFLNIRKKALLVVVYYSMYLLYFFTTQLTVGV